jgi:hypothetical protein
LAAGLCALLLRLISTVLSRDPLDVRSADAEVGKFAVVKARKLADSGPVIPPGLQQAGK